MADPRHARRIALFTFLGHALTHLYIILFTPLLEPMRQDFSLSLADITAYYALVNLFFGLGAVPAGWLSARLGDKPLLAAFFLGSALGGALIGLAPGTATLTAGVVVLGLATSIYHPVGMALLSKGARLKGMAMGLNGIAGSLGTALGPLLAAAVLRAGVSWRWAFLVLTGPSLLLGLWFAASDLGPAAAPAPRKSREPGGTGAGGSWRRVPRERIVLWSFLLLAMTLAGFSTQMALTMLPLLLARTGPLSYQHEAGAFRASLSLGFSAAGQFLAGLLCDRARDQRKLYIAALAAAAPLVLLLGHASGWGLLALSCAASLAVFAVQPIENTIIARYSPSELRGVIYGAKFILVFGLGSLGCWRAGVAAEGRGLPQVYHEAGLVAVLALLAAFAAALLRLSPRPAPPPAEPAVAIPGPSGSR